MIQDADFYRTHAGFSCLPDEDVETAKDRSAAELVLARQWAEDEGGVYEWSDFWEEGHVSRDHTLPSDPYQITTCETLTLTIGELSVSRSGMDDMDGNGRDVLEAELARQIQGVIELTPPEILP